MVVVEQHVHTPLRVRNAHALRCQRKYEKAERDKSISARVLYRMRREALPSEPCTDCGRRMKCANCDKEELLEALMEDYISPPDNFSKEVQVNISAEVTNDNEAEMLALLAELKELKENQDLFRARVDKKNHALDTATNKCEIALQDLAHQCEECDRLQTELKHQTARAEDAERTLAQREEAFQRALDEKVAEIACLHALRVKQIGALGCWLEKQDVKLLLREVCSEWGWFIQLSKKDRAWQETLAQTEREYTVKMENAAHEHEVIIASFEKRFLEEEEKAERLVAAHEDAVAATNMVKTELAKTHLLYEEDTKRLEKELDRAAEECSISHRQMEKISAILEESGICVDIKDIISGDSKGLDLLAAEIERGDWRQAKDFNPEDEGCLHFYGETETGQSLNEDGVAMKQGNIRGAAGRDSRDACPDGQKYPVSEDHDFAEFEELNAMTEDLSVRLRQQDEKVAQLQHSLENAEAEIIVATSRLTRSKEKVTILNQCLNGERKKQAEYKQKFAAMQTQLIKQKADLEVRLQAHVRRFRTRDRLTTNEDVDAASRDIRAVRLSKKVGLLETRLRRMRMIANACIQKEVRLAMMREAKAS